MWAWPVHHCHWNRPVDIDQVNEVIKRRTKLFSKRDLYNDLQYSDQPHKNELQGVNVKLQLALMDIELLKPLDIQEYLPASCVAFCHAPQDDDDKDLGCKRVQLVTRMVNDSLLGHCTLLRPRSVGLRRSMDKNCLCTNLRKLPCTPYHQ